MGGLDNCDPVLLDLFRAEMDTHLPALSQGLLALEKGKAGPKDLEAMMRAAHSIKGAARIVGVEAAVRVAHGMEDCFSAAQGQRLILSSDAVDVLLRGLDALQSICSPQAGAVMTEESIASLLGEIAAVRDGELSASPPQQTQKIVSPHAPQIDAAARPLKRVSGTVRAEGTVMNSSAESQVSRLRLPEIFDDGAAQSLHGELCDILQRAPSRLSLDFSHVRQISTAAFSLLASLAREISQGRSALTVDAEGVSESMAVLLRTSGLDRSFNPIG